MLCQLVSRQSETKFPVDGYDITKLPDETLIELFNTAPLLHDYQRTCIGRLSRKFVLKGRELVRPCEAETMKLVEAKTSISVLKVHEVVNIKMQDTFFGCHRYFIMDFIEGDTTQDYWEDLNQAQRENVVSQEVFHSGMLQQWRIGLTTNLKSSRVSSKLQILFQAPDTVALFSFDKLVLYYTSRYCTPDLRLDPKDKVWLIDWGDAGISPEGFEYAALAARRWTAVLFTNVFFESLNIQIWRGNCLKLCMH
ncbi:hypothetical protein PABG_04158 [Paracoccidioides brasiliensis Pb03]|nr:hypothetical protein PABG_04158 [Paracoccidioides brasiliensis Pb03]